MQNAIDKNKHVGWNGGGGGGVSWGYYEAIDRNKWKGRGWE